ncbi:MAG: patatin-like phospholipase family protein [Candidatus Aminicenantes bacterium]|nr:MAG: patatin-like phospholipase family protein [Candidatus Aminicenantes bacterium]
MKNLMRIFRTKKQQWGLVLMGGGARGLAHIGILDIFQKEGLSPDVIVGTSMGAIVGGLFSFGFSPMKLKEIMKDLNLEQFVDRPNLPFLPRRPHSILEFFLLDAYRARLQKKIGQDKEDKLEEHFKATVGDVRIEDLPIRFACNAVDLISGKEVIFERGELYKALRATMSLPVVFEPVSMDDMLLVDGGVLNNVPVETAKKLGAEKTILVDIHRPLKKVSTQEINSTFQLIQRMVETMAANTTIERIKDADCVIRVDLDVDIFDFTSPEELIEEGERAAREKLAAVKKLVH